MFDSDIAGEKAASKTLDIAIEFPNLYFKVVVLPKGEDPDSYLIKHGPSMCTNLMREAKDLI